MSYILDYIISYSNNLKKVVCESGIKVSGCYQEIIYIFDICFLFFFNFIIIIYFLSIKFNCEVYREYSAILNFAKDPNLPFWHFESVICKDFLLFLFSLLVALLVNSLLCDYVLCVYTHLYSLSLRKSCSILCDFLKSHSVTINKVKVAGLFEESRGSAQACCLSHTALKSTLRRLSFEGLAVYLDPWRALSYLRSIKRQ